MLIAILSDSHDAVERVRRLEARILRDHRPELVLHCGDICSAPCVEALAAWPVQWVWGNCDWDRKGLLGAMKSAGHDPAEDSKLIEVGGRRLGLCHSHRPRDFEALLHAEVDYLFHGHTHEQRDERIGVTRVINPGAIQRARYHTIALLDLEQDSLEMIDVDAS